MRLIYVKTDEISLDTFLIFCFRKLSKKYTDKSSFNKFWLNKLKYKYIDIFNTSIYVLINNQGEYIGCLDVISDVVYKNHSIWDIENVDLVNPYEEEFFDFEKYNFIIDKDKFKINNIGFNKKNDWIYMEIENKYTHYRNYIINIDTFINIKRYIRYEKIKNLLEY